MIFISLKTANKENEALSYLCQRLVAKANLPSLYGRYRNMLLGRNTLANHKETDSGSIVEARKQEIRFKYSELTVTGLKSENKDASCVYLYCKIIY